MKDKFDSLPPELHLGGAFLDCGAYSVLTGQWNFLPLTDYERFVAKNHKAFALIAAPDVIGNAAATMGNLGHFCTYLNKAFVLEHIAHKIVLTYHLSDKDPKCFAYMLNYAQDVGIEWIAVGGIVDPSLKKEVRFIGVDNVLKMVNRDLFKVHLFGGHDPELIRAFKPDSVDSSSYVAAGKNLTALIPDNWRIKKFKIPRDSQELQLGWMRKILDRFYPGIIDAAGTTINKVMIDLARMPDGIRMWLLNGLGVLYFEDFVRRGIKNPDFRYWVTMDPNMFECAFKYGKEAGKVFIRIWRNHCLVAYPQYWESGTEGKNLVNLEYFS